MRLARPLQRLPIRFDAERLRREAEALPEEAWVAHPQAIPGNSAVRLISTLGAQNDETDAPMAMTAHLRASPYLRQVLASFGVVWSRSRLLRLAPYASVPAHADIAHHWYTRVRVHVPIVTHPRVRFRCGEDTVHMAAGDAWIFDNWRTHEVVNDSPQPRIHLVADTSGSSAFWTSAGRTLPAGSPVPTLPWDPAREATPLLERHGQGPVMPPAELEWLIEDLQRELAAGSDEPDAEARLNRYRSLLTACTRDWRQLHALHGSTREGWREYERLRDRVREASAVMGKGLAMATNGVEAHRVLEARVLRACFRPRLARQARLDRPVFIIAAPRSGSTLLFETLARCRGFSTLGGEAHALIERHPELRPGAGAVESNRLEVRHATDTLAAGIIEEILDSRVDADGCAVPEASPLRLLEKTPKNALRIPFIEQLFPDARYVFLWREPRASLASLIEAWGSGQWQTYPHLEGFDRPWSLLLPPGWPAMRGRTLAQIAAFQWESANRIALEDLAALPTERWCRVEYDEFVAEPAATVQRLCAFAEVDFDDALRAHLTQPLPLSRYTQTPPAPGKWRHHAAEIEPLMPGLEGLWRRLQENPGDPEKQYA